MSSSKPCWPSVSGFVVAIDGPAGAGKSTASRKLAERLGFQFLDTGAMYRCVTLAVLRAGIDTSDQAAVARLAQGLDIQLTQDAVVLDGIDVSDAIRSPEVSAAIGAVADNRQVRDLLSCLQRQWASDKLVVTEGRDQGTVVFYDSPCKIFLTASDQERARRRCDELRLRGLETDYESVLLQQQQRDAEDYRRPYGGLRIADDATVVMTDGLSLQQVVDRLVAIAQQRLADSARETGPDADGRPHSITASTQPGVSIEGRP